MCSVRTLRRISCGFVTVILGCTALAANYEQTPVSPEEVRRQSTQDELADRRQAEQLDLVRQTTQFLYMRALTTKEMFTKLKQQTESFFSRMETLLQSDEGKRLGLDPIGARFYQGLKDYPTVTMVEIEERAQAVSALVNRLESFQSGPAIALPPSQETQDQVNEQYFWVRSRLNEIQEDIGKLNDTVRQATSDFDPAKAKTLQVLLEELDAQFDRTLIDYRMLGEKKATKEVKQIVIDAAYLRRVERANAEEQIRRRQMEAELAHKKAEVETAVSNQLIAAQQRQFEAEKKYTDALAEIERLRKQAEVDRQVADIDADLQRDAKLTDAEKKQKIALAQSSEVAELLAPFLTPGYWQVGAPSASYEKQPLSFSQIVAKGALNQTSEGLQALLTIGINRNDKIRPRWGFRHRLKDLSEPEHEQLHKAQEYLINLGPTMVELGLLAK